MIIPHRLTPVLVASLPELLDAAYHTVVGTCPGGDAVDVLIAHLELEHGVSLNDGAPMLRGVWCNNLGNVDATFADRADPTIKVFTTVPECEGTACQYRALHTRRAWESAEDGVVGYVQAMRDRFADALWAASNGPRAFVVALDEAGYFTGDAEAYAIAVERIYAQRQRERAVG